MICHDKGPRREVSLVRLRVRHVASDGMRFESEALIQAKTPKAGAKMFAHRHHVARGERIEVLMEMGDDPLNYEVSRSRIDDGGCRVQYVGKNHGETTTTLNQAYRQHGG